MLPLLRQCLVVFVWLCLASPVRSDTLRIVTTPPGANVEINGITVGVTPFSKSYPGGYFHRTLTSFGKRLQHPMVVRLKLAGYATKELVLTLGPEEWVGVNGKHHGEYWLFKGDHFEVALDLIEKTFDGSINARLPAGLTVMAAPLALPDLAEKVKPCVVKLKGLNKTGSGFFVTETGLIATNAHVVRDEGELQVVLSNGQQLQGEVLFIDTDRDLAFVKVQGSQFPHLTLAAQSTVRQGDSVFAVGNPADGMEFSMTKGIVSAVGRFPNAGPGIWVQTDAQINPGNSGGPLINMAGEVVGLATQKQMRRGVTGIAFALSASDLLEVLQQFYSGKLPISRDQAIEKMSGSKESSPAKPPSFWRLTIEGTRGAHIFVDGGKASFGDVPSSTQLAGGFHVIRVEKTGFREALREIYVDPGNTPTLVFDLNPFP